eukprot:TRINITY_DN11339_c0_g1_i1.p1 TRINITY_DN11339_c0_g1~~TRINITY_DN11339_c0_g1_i1.p1  ORF type:complete len:414 (+),score=85.62 TRINITY_DN11339_c0_g1_i1:104-1345(+)
MSGSFGGIGRLSHDEDASSHDSRNSRRKGKIAKWDDMSVKTFVAVFASTYPIFHRRVGLQDILDDPKSKFWYRIIYRMKLMGYNKSGNACLQKFDELMKESILNIEANGSVTTHLDLPVIKIFENMDEQEEEHSPPSENHQQSKSHVNLNKESESESEVEPGEDSRNKYDQEEEFVSPRRVSMPRLASAISATNPMARRGAKAKTITRSSISEMHKPIIATSELQKKSGAKDDEAQEKPTKRPYKRRRTGNETGDPASNANTHTDIPDTQPEESVVISQNEKYDDNTKTPKTLPPRSDSRRQGGTVSLPNTNGNVDSHTDQGPSQPTESQHVRTRANSAKQSSQLQEVRDPKSIMDILSSSVLDPVQLSDDHAYYEALNAVKFSLNCVLQLYRSRLQLRMSQSQQESDDDNSQ